MAYFHDRIYVVFLGFLRIQAQDIIRILLVQVLRGFFRNKCRILCSIFTNDVALQEFTVFALPLTKNQIFLSNPTTRSVEFAFKI